MKTLFTSDTMKIIITRLTLFLILLVTAAAANAQGGLFPMEGSTHTYSVTPASTSNTLAWSADLGTGYTIVSGAATSEVTIKWTAAGTYVLQFSETDINTGCQTIKQKTVVVGSNTFDVSVITPAAVCNGADGQVNYEGTTATTPVTFQVQMASGNSAFSPGWQFNFTVASATGATINSVTASTGTLTGSAGSYTLAGLTSASGSGTVSITVEAEGEVFTSETVTLTLSEVKETTYNTPDVDTDDLAATGTINAIPNTSDISVN